MNVERCIKCGDPIPEGRQVCEACELDPIKSPLLTKNFNLPKDPVNHPSHYTDGKIEVIDFIEDKKLGFHLGNAIKYIARAGKKNKDKEIEDLEKAIWYIKRRIKNIQEEPKIVAVPVKHDAPIGCKIRVKLFGVSPSVIFGRCNLGCKSSCKKCKGCKCNVREMIHENFILGLQRGGVYID